MSILEEIIAWKKQEIESRKAKVPFTDLQKRLRDLPPPLPVLEQFAAKHGFAFICEIKRASPSAGELASKLDPVEQARKYQAGGAAGISVLTDQRYFRGSPEDLCLVRRAVSLPLLRKDFILEPYQLYESRLLGADLVLLIAAALERETLRELIRLAQDLRLTPLVEIHDRKEIDRLPDLDKCLLGVNNRDLRTFRVDLRHSLALRPLLPDGVPVISESGVKTAGDCRLLKQAGFQGALIGEALVTCPDPVALLQEFRKGVEHATTN